MSKPSKSTPIATADDFSNTICAISEGFTAIELFLNSMSGLPLKRRSMWITQLIKSCETRDGGREAGRMTAVVDLVMAEMDRMAQCEHRYHYIGNRRDARVCDRCGYGDDHNFPEHPRYKPPQASARVGRK